MKMKKLKTKIKVIGFISCDKLEELTEKEFNMRMDILNEVGTHFYPQDSYSSREEMYEKAEKVLEKYLWRHRYLYSGEEMQNRGIPVLMDTRSKQVMTIWITWRMWGGFISEIVNKHTKLNTDYMWFYMNNYKRCRFPKYDTKKVEECIRRELQTIYDIWNEQHRLNRTFEALGQEKDLF